MYDGVVPAFRLTGKYILIRSVWARFENVRLKTTMNTQTYPQPIPVADLDENSRGRFISRTYTHLFSAITAFTLLEVILFKTGAAETIARLMLGTSWLLVLGGFVVVSW